MPMIIPARDSPVAIQRNYGKNRCLRKKNTPVAMILRHTGGPHVPMNKPGFSGMQARLMFYSGNVVRIPGG